MPEGYWVHRSAFIATRETFFMLDGDGCLLLDPQTGVEQQRLALPDVKGEWKWMVLKGTLFRVAAFACRSYSATHLSDRQIHCPISIRRVVFTFAKLCAMVSMCVCCAIMPVAAVNKARIIVLSPH